MLQDLVHDSIMVECRAVDDGDSGVYFVSSGC